MDNKVYQIITDRIIEKLQQGTAPWHKPWSGGIEGAPRNLVSRKEYRGCNVFLLACQGYESPFWLTFNQAKERKANIRKGEKGSPVVFWKFSEKAEESEDGETKQKSIPILRYYTVFNVAQCDNLDAPTVPSPTERPFAPIETAQRLVDAMPQRPAIEHREQRAYYRPSADIVNMPRAETFDGPAEYHSTLFHELVHSTGHTSRLDRKGVSGSDGEWSAFGSAPYAREELVAEIGATFLCGFSGIENRTIDNSAAYLNSWIARLKSDPKLIVTAAAQAQKAADFIRGINRKEDAHP